MSQAFETVKAWCHWKRIERDISESDLEMVKDLEDLISQVGTWKAKAEKFQVEVDEHVAEFLAEHDENVRLHTQCEELLAENAKLNWDWNRQAKFMNSEMLKLGVDNRALSAKRDELQVACDELDSILNRTEFRATLECQAKMERRLALAEKVVEAARDLGMGCTVDDQWTAHPAISYVEIQVEKDARIDFLTALATYDAMKREINERK
jgi:hypothetical protein